MSLLIIKKTLTSGLLSVFVFVIFVETVALHLLVSKWSPVIAWILSGLSIYTAIQVFGLLRSLGKRPARIERDRLVLRYGIWAEAEIQLENISLVELSEDSKELNGPVKSLSPFTELEGHNVVIKLKEESVLFSVYGIRKRFSTLLLHLDEKEQFKRQIDEALISFRTKDL